jgi:hypothetical protein
MKTKSRASTPFLSGIVLASLALFSTIGFAAEKPTAPDPLMVTKGKQIIAKDFNEESDVDKASMAFRKQTQFRIEEGQLHVIPPAIAFAGTANDNEWASSSMARAGLIELPQEFVCQFRWKYNESENPKYASKGSAYIDLGHRCIRTTFTREGTTLKLENHLVGKEATESSKLLLEDSKLKLEPEKWYDITIEVKGDEVLFQIDGHLLFGKDDLIAKERANTFNIDSGGDGYVLDSVEIWEAGDYQRDWAAQRKSIANK